MTQGKFTQAELEIAYEQMRQEREADVDLTGRAIVWLRQYFPLHSMEICPGNRLMGEDIQQVHPFRRLPRIKLNYCQYDIPQQELELLLRNHNDKVKLIETPIGYYRKIKFYSLDLANVPGFPDYAKFEFYLKEYDAHTAG